MRCSACHRSLAKPALELAGMVFGPVCSRKLLEATGKLAPRKPRATAGETQVVRDKRTPDMFEGVA